MLTFRTEMAFEDVFRPVNRWRFVDAASLFLMLCDAVFMSESSTAAVALPWTRAKLVTNQVRGQCRLLLKSLKYHQSKT